MDGESKKEFQYTPKVYPEIQLFDVEPHAPLFYGISNDTGDYVETFGDVDPPILNRINGERRERYPEEGLMADLLLSFKGAQSVISWDIENTQDELLDRAGEFLSEVPDSDEFRDERTAIRGMIKRLKQIKQQKLTRATSADAYRALETQLNAHIGETDMPYFLALQSHPIVTPVAGRRNELSDGRDRRYYSFNPLNRIAIGDDGAVSFYVRTPEEESVRVDDAVREGWAIIDVLFRAVEPQYDEELRDLLEQNRV